MALYLEFLISISESSNEIGVPGGMHSPLMLP
jgi:hypothetical protein